MRMEVERNKKKNQKSKKIEDDVIKDVKKPF